MSSPQRNGLLVEQWPIDRPQPYFRNPRVVTVQAIDKVAASLKEFGWRQPIVVDSEEIVVVGHTRLLAARKLGLLTVPVHVAADLTPQQAKAYRIADNRVGEETKWAPEALRLEMADLDSAQQLATGFDPGDPLLEVAGAELLDPYGDDSGSELGMQPRISWGRAGRTIRGTPEDTRLLDLALAGYMQRTGGTGGFVHDLAAPESRKA